MEVNVVWWRLRTSNPSKSGNALGKFDSYTPQPKQPYGLLVFAKLKMQEREADEVIICFENAFEAIMAERTLVPPPSDASQQQPVAVRIMPLPVGIRAGCGFCLRLAPKDLVRAAAILAAHGIIVNEAWKTSETGAYSKIAIGNTADTDPPGNPQE